MLRQGDPAEETTGTGAENGLKPSRNLVVPS